MEIDFLHHLENKTFVGPKPDDEMEGVLERVADVEKTGRLIKQRKRDGYSGTIAINGGYHSRRVNLFSRQNTPWTGKFPRVETALSSLRGVRDSLLLGEMHVNVRGIDDPDLFGRFARTNTDGSLELQKQYPPVRLALFNILVHEGRDVTHLPYRDRFDLIRNICDGHVSCIAPVETIDMPLKKAVDHSTKHEWEGLVFNDANAPTEMRFNGDWQQPPRPYGSWKWKGVLDGDFIARGWIPSDSAKYKGLVRDLKLYQRDPETGEEVYWGPVGNGLSEEQKKLFTDDSLYPFVVEVRFQKRTPAGVLKFARIRRVRDDKRPEECFSPRRAA